MKKIAAIMLLLLVLTSCSSTITNLGGYTPYNDIPDGYTVEDAKADKLVVSEDGNITSGQEVWDEFLAQTEKGEPYMVRLASYFPEIIDEDVQDLYILDLSYDVKEYTLYSIQNGKEYTYKYEHLKRFDETEPPTEHSTYNSAVHYYLVNDLDVTYDQIIRGMLSSKVGDAIDCYGVYTKYDYR